MNSITQIIDSIKSTPRLNPTEIYNEGWMTRLLVYHSIQQKISIQGIEFEKLSNWTSEALISSPFVKADTRREGYTHADMTLGDFDVDYAKRGEVVVRPIAQLFGIIEAKMGSNLSQGTTTVNDGYNQASRNVACIASNTFKYDCDIFFGVAAPADTLSKHHVDQQLAAIEEQIHNRFAYYDELDEPSNKDKKVIESRDAIIEKAKMCRTWSLSYEDWIASFTATEVRNELAAFYKDCRKWNRLS